MPVPVVTALSVAPNSFTQLTVTPGSGASPVSQKPLPLTSSKTRARSVPSSWLPKVAVTVWPAPSVTGTVVEVVARALAGTTSLTLYCPSGMFGQMTTPPAVVPVPALSTPV